MHPIYRGLAFLALAALGPVATAAAQSFSGGVIVGVSSSTVSNFGNVGPTTLRHRTGVVAGLSVEASLARFASLQLEILYVQKGIRLDGPLVAGASSASASLTERFDYVEVPILVRLGATAARPGLYVLARVLRSPYSCAPGSGSKCPGCRRGTRTSSTASRAPMPASSSAPDSRPGDSGSKDGSTSACGT